MISKCLLSSFARVPHPLHLGVLNQQLVLFDIFLLFLFFQLDWYFDILQSRELMINYKMIMQLGQMPKNIFIYLSKNEFNFTSVVVSENVFVYICALKAFLFDFFKYDFCLLLFLLILCLVFLLNLFN